jgi:aspartate ammonia-lyase
MGRTELQDAVPMTVGQEFYAFAAVARRRDRRSEGRREVPLRREHGRDRDRHRHQRAEGLRRTCAQELAKLTGKPIVMADDMIAATWDQQGFVVYSGALKSTAIKLAKIASDLILLASGPRAGLAEINSPAIQPGSSIMPGKVNPVVPKSWASWPSASLPTTSPCRWPSHSGQLPAQRLRAAQRLGEFESQHLLFNVSKLLRTRCVDGITVNEKVLEHYMETRSASSPRSTR